MTAAIVDGTWDFRGVVEDMDDTEYHAFYEILSSSGARDILPPSCPAEFRWKQEHRVEKPYFDEGHAAHKLVLGIGQPIVEIPFTSWQYKEAKLQREAAYQRNEIPLLTEKKQMVEDMAAALQKHPVARDLLQGGKPEQSLFWDDPSGAVLRARPDYAWDDWSTLIDYKTSTSAQPEAFAQAVAKYRYHMQDDFYSQGVINLELHPDPRFLFIVQSKEPPYAVSVVQLDGAARSMGYHLNRQAIELFASCQRTAHWPEWGNRIHVVGLSGYHARQQEELLIQLTNTGGGFR